MAIVEKKPWYKSKIIMLALSAALVFGSNLLGGWLTGQGVTQEQMDALSTAQPEVAHAIERVQAGENVLGVVGSLVSVFILIFRTWFTSKQIG